MSTDIRYVYSDNATELLGDRDIAHLAGKYLTRERLENSAFAIAAEKDGFTGGIIIGELPWGEIGAQWDRHVPDSIELGALFVDPSWRNTPAAFRLMNLAVSAAARLGRTPVAVTEIGSPVYRYLARTGAAQTRRQFTHNGVTYLPWVLTPALTPAAA